MNRMSLTVPTLETDRLIVRPWREGDAADIFEYSSDLEVTRHAMWLPDESLEDVKHGIADAIRRYEKESWMYLGVELKEESKFIGSIGFAQWNQSDRRAEFGFALNRKYWGRGIALEAARPMIAFGWDAMKLHRIEARTIAENAPSIAILTKLGFQREGISREAACVDGTFRDVIQWGLLEE